jgi:hypothetical protein
VKQKLTFELASSKRASEGDITKGNFLPLQDQSSAAESKKKSCSAPTNIDKKSNVDAVICCATNEDRVPPVPLSSHDMVYGKEEHWISSYIEDQLYLQMCEKEIKDPQGKCCNKQPSILKQPNMQAG